MGYSFVPAIESNTTFRDFTMLTYLCLTPFVQSHVNVPQWVRYSDHILCYEQRTRRRAVPSTRVPEMLRTSINTKRP
eukprot:1117758-Rhodomonas_salina.3